MFASPDKENVAHYVYRNTALPRKDDILMFTTTLIELGIIKCVVSRDRQTCASQCYLYAEFERKIEVKSVIVITQGWVKLGERRKREVNE